VGAKAEQKPGERSANSLNNLTRRDFFKQGAILLLGVLAQRCSKPEFSSCMNKEPSTAGSIACAVELSISSYSSSSPLGVIGGDGQMKDMAGDFIALRSTRSLRVVGSELLSDFFLIREDAVYVPTPGGKFLELSGAKLSYIDSGSGISVALPLPQDMRVIDGAEAPVTVVVDGIESVLRGKFIYMSARHAGESTGYYGERKTFDIRGFKMEEVLLDLDAKIFYVPYVGGEKTGKWCWDSTIENPGLKFWKEVIEERYEYNEVTGKWETKYEIPSETFRVEFQPSGTTK